MNIVHDDLFKQRLLNQLKERVFKEREGTHYSDLNYCLRKPFFRKKYPAISESNSEQTILTFSFGLAIERWLVEDYEQEVIVVDDIHLTPDYVQEDGEAWEIKTTNLSHSKDIGEQKTYIRQMMAYCKALNILTFRMPIIHMMGNWSWVYRKGKEVDERHPTLNCWRFDFAQEEIDANWQEALSKKAMLEAAIKDDEMPEAIRESWECSKNFWIWNNNMICDPSTRD